MRRQRQVHHITKNPTLGHVTHLIEGKTQVDVNELGRFEINKNVERVSVTQAKRETHDAVSSNAACVRQTALKPLGRIPVMFSEEVSVQERATTHGGDTNCTNRGQDHNHGR